MTQPNEIKTEKTPVHQWTNSDGDVFILRFCDRKGRAWGGFRYPLVVGQLVEAPDKWKKSWGDKPWDWKSGFTANQECGGGLHGWAWGIGMGEGKDPEWNALWQVYAVRPEDVVGNVGNGVKCKFRSGVLKFSGDWHGAMMFILDGQKQWVEHFADGDSHATGDRSASSATGYSSASSATGDRSASSATGYRSASSATGDSSASSATGDSSASSATGDRSASSATGYSSASSATGDSSASSATGDRSASSATGYSSASSATGKASAAVVTGYCGKAQAGEYGCVALSFWNSKESRYEMKCREIGCGDGSDGKLKANTWYKLDDAGEFVEAN